MSGRQTEPIGAPDRVVFASAPKPGFERIHVPQPSDSTNIPISREVPASGDFPSQVRSHNTASRAYHPMGNPDENRVYPSIETPQSPPRRGRVDHLGERDHQPMSDEYHRQPQTSPRRPVDELSRKVKVIGIDDERDQMLYKRRRVEYNTPLRENIPPENRIHEVRPIAAPHTDKPREPQYISLISPASGRGSDRMHPRIRDENTGPLNEFSPVVGRQLEKHPVGRAPSLIPIHHNPGFSESFDREGGHNYRAPISLHRSRHDLDASLNSFKPHPVPVSLNRDSGYMVRDNGHTVRSNQVSNLAEPRSQFVDRAARQVSEVPRPPREQPFRESAQPLAMRENGPVRHHYISNQGPQMGGERPHEFARPLQLRERETASYYDMPRFLAQDRQPGHIPSPRMERDPHADQSPYRMPDRPAPGTHIYRYPSPQHPYPSTQIPVSGQPRLVRIGPGPAPQDTERFMIHSPTSTTPRDTRGRPSLDNGRYAYRRVFDGRRFE